jgi:hypothetical protein
LNQTLKGDLALLREQEKNEKRLPPQVGETKATAVEADVPF